MPPRPHERLLRNIFGPSRVADDGEGTPVHPPLESPNERQRRVSVAHDQTSDQSLVRRVPHVVLTAAGAGGIGRRSNPSDRLSVCSGMRKILILLGAVAVFVAGCGGGGSSTPVKLSGDTTNKGTKDLSGTSIDVEQHDFFYSPTFIKGGTPGATITVHLKNVGQNPHTFTVAALGIDTTVEAGATADVQVTLPQSGATEFHCKFHQQSNGMQGAFFFKDGDTVVGAGAGTGTNSSSSSSDAGGYNYPN